MPQIGKYQTLELLGSGALSTLYRAYDAQLQRVVALRVLHLDRLHDVAAQQADARLRATAAALSRLAHPGIATVYECRQDGGYAYIAREFVDGSTLSARSAKHCGLTPADAVAAAIQVLDALSHAHARGVTHGDLKPSNVLVDGEGMTRITDFGVAAIGERNSQDTGLLVGSMEYLAPEQFRGVPLDERCDIHAAGVLIYEMLTGVSPFAGANGVAMFRVCDEVPAAPSRVKPGLPPAFDACIARSLAKRPKDRFESAQSFRDALRSAYLAQAGAEPPRALQPVRSVDGPAIADSAAGTVRSGWPSADPPVGRSSARVESHPAPAAAPAATVVMRRPWAPAAAIAADRPSAGVTVPDATGESAAASSASAFRPRSTPDSPTSAYGTGPEPHTPTRAPASPIVTKGGQGAAALPDDTVLYAGRALAHYLGPIATVLAHNAAKQAHSEAHFFQLLLAHLRSAGEREALELDISRWQRDRSVARSLGDGP
jgi:eukaryotic-like serine/threonine-protein kinase